MPDRRRLAPGEVAKELFGLVPDRDERASQLCTEMLCMLVANGYSGPNGRGTLRGPKLRRFAVRSLVLGENFLDRRTGGRAGRDEYTPQRYGGLLAAGGDFLGSANLTLARAALRGLVDPSTEMRQPGSRLLLPFHESLIWFDSRRTTGNPWTVRKVYMRGSGITLARLLLDPPEYSARFANAATSAIKAALRADSPLARIAEHLEGALPPDEHPSLEQDEIEAWNYGKDPRLEGLAASIPRHAEGVMGQGQASAPARLWQLRTVLALDVIRHVVKTAWVVTETAEEQRFFLLTFGGGPRAANRVRHRSEQSYQQARIRIKEATVRTMERVMHQIGLREAGAADWGSEFEARTRLGGIIKELQSRSEHEYSSVARRTFEGGAYDRSGDGFRVLLESIGMLAGTGPYRYLTATPDLLGAMVGALSPDMPMESRDFFDRVYREWGIVISADAADATGLLNQLDGAELSRNQQRAEHVMVEAGLAIALSDRTTIVGERAARTT